MYFIPKYALTPTVLVHNGVSKDKYPLLHQLLYDDRVSILAVVMSFTLIWFTLSLKRGRINY
jgi:hypothetical protein